MSHGPKTRFVTCKVEADWLLIFPLEQNPWFNVAITSFMGQPLSNHVLPIRLNKQAIFFYHHVEDTFYICCNVVASNNQQRRCGEGSWEYIAWGWEVLRGKERTCNHPFWPRKEADQKMNQEKIIIAINQFFFASK